MDLDLLAWVDKAETRLEKAEDSQQQRKAFKEKCRLDPDDDECQLGRRKRDLAERVGGRGGGSWVS